MTARVPNKRRRPHEAARDGGAPASRAVLRAGDLPGSYAAHQSLQRAVLDLLALHRVPAIAVHTGPRVRPRAGGGFELRQNREQRGLSDVLACLPPDGRMALLELKTGGAQRSKEQVEVQERFAKTGALCVVIRDARDVLPLVARRAGQSNHQGAAT